MYQITSEQLDKLQNSMEQLTDIIKTQDRLIKELTEANLKLPGYTAVKVGSNGIAGEPSEK